MRQPFLERGHRRWGRRRADGTADRHRVRLQVEVLERLLAAFMARLRANAGRRSSASSASSIAQSSGIASSDSTRWHAGDHAPARPRRGQLGHPVHPRGRQQFGVVVGEEDEVIVAERLRGCLVTRHVRVVVGEERLDRLLVAHSLAGSRPAARAGSRPRRR